MKNKELNIKLVKSKPHKVYKINTTQSSHIKAICNFLKNNKDKEIEIIINGKKTKLNSIISKKRFAYGLEQGSLLIQDYSKTLFKNMQDNIDNLKNRVRELEESLKESKINEINADNKVRAVNDLYKIRNDMYKNYISEIEQDRESLRKELDKINKLIKKVASPVKDNDSLSLV